MNRMVWQCFMTLEIFTKTLQALATNGYSFVYAQVQLLNFLPLKDSSASLKAVHISTYPNNICADSRIFACQCVCTARSAL